MTELQIDEKTLWEKVLTEIESSVSKANFSTWFKDTQIAKFEDGIIYIAVENAFVRDWLANKYHKTILKSLRELAEQVRGLDYIITKIDKKKNGDFKQAKGPELESFAHPLGDCLRDGLGQTGHAAGDCLCDLVERLERVQFGHISQE